MIETVGTAIAAQETACPACGDAGTEIQFDGKTLFLHCLKCGSDTAGDALLTANRVISEGNTKIADLERQLTELRIEANRAYNEGWRDAQPGRGAP
jgi:tRNA(Ile2) C34 agmatinyltransferase TiaS